MGRYAETATVDHLLSFADLWKQSSVFRFPLQQTNGSLPFPFSVCSKQTEVVIFLVSVFCIYIYGKQNYIYISCCFKQKTKKRPPQAIFLNPFTICSSCKCKFVVCLFVDEETNGSYPFANYLRDWTDLPTYAYKYVQFTVIAVLKTMVLYMRYSCQVLYFDWFYSYPVI
jgi:hypothetical protein